MIARLGRWLLRLCRAAIGGIGPPEPLVHAAESASLPTRPETTAARDAADTLDRSVVRWQGGRVLRVTIVDRSTSRAPVVASVENGACVRSCMDGRGREPYSLASMSPRTAGSLPGSGARRPNTRPVRECQHDRAHLPRGERGRLMECDGIDP